MPRAYTARNILGAILPRLCQVCEIPTSNTAVCFRCQPKIIDLQLKRCKTCFQLLDQTTDEETCSACMIKPSHFLQSRHIWYYDPITRDYITTMKYSASRLLCKLAGQELAKYIELLFDTDWDCVVPVPIAEQNKFKRGFNQSNYLVKYLPGKKIINCLAPKAKRKPQAGLKHKKRKANMQNAFKCNYNLRGKSILLVDDVLTTGATAKAAAFALLNNHAKQINLLTLASTKL